jgi:hypothetical protein
MTVFVPRLEARAYFACAAVLTPAFLFTLIDHIVPTTSP